MADGKIVIETGLDNSGVESGLKRLKGVVVKGVAALGIGALAKGAINVGKSFEAGMSEVQAISGATGKDLEDLTNKAKEMGAKTKFSATQSAEALKYMAMAGWDSEQMLSGLEGVMNLAAASGEDLGSVSDIVTDAMTAFGLQASESAHFADVLAKASSSSNTNVGLMGETFKYVAPVAGSMKYSIEDTATAIGLMANAGIKGGQAGTALRSILTRLVKPPKDAADALETLGVSAKNSDGSMKPLREVIGDLREKFSGLSESQKAQFAASIAGQEAMSGLLAIVEASDTDFDKLTKSIENSTGAAKKQADTMNDNLKGAMFELSSAAEAVGIEIYDGIKEPLTKAAKIGATRIRGLASKLNKNGIKSIIPEEAINTVKNLGSVAKAVGGGGVKVLSKSLGLLADNLDVVVPLTSAYFGAMAGYKVFGLASSAMKKFSEAQGILNAMQTAVGIFTGKISLATAATRAFNTVCTALGGPLGIALVATGALTAGVAAYAFTQKRQVSEEQKLIESVEKSAEKQREYLKEVKENQKGRQEAIATTQAEGKQADMLSAQLDDLMSVENKSVGQKERIKSIVEKLNSLIPNLGLAYDEEKDKLNKSTEAIRKNIDAQKELALAKAYGAQTESIISDIVKAETELEKVEKKRADVKKKMEAAEKEVAEARETGIAPKDNVYLDIALEKQTQLSKAYEKSDEQVKKYQSSLDSLNAELDTMNNREIGHTNYAAYLQDIDKLKKEAKLKAKDIPDSIAEGIKEGAYANPTTGKELKSLIKLDGFVREAQEAGLNVPVSIVQGIQMGQYAVPASVQALENLITFDSISQKASEQGAKVPTELANQISAGKVTLDEAVKKLCDATGLTADDLGVTHLLKETAGKAKKLSGEVTKNAKVKPADNSASGSKSESSFNANYSKGKGKVKKTSSDISKASEIKGQDNSKGAKKSKDSYVNTLDKGKREAKKTTQEIEKSAKDGFGSSKSEFQKEGSESGKAYIKGINSQKGAAQKAGKTLATSAKKGANAEKSGFHSVGSNMSAGIASGIIGNSSAVSSAARNVVKKAKSAAKAEADIHSPSKVFEKEVGKFLPLGMASGIRKNTKDVEDASREMAAASLTATADELEIHSPSRKFKRAIGVNIPRGIASGVRAARTELVGEMKSTVSEALSAAKSLTKAGKYSQVGSDLISELSEAINLSKTRSSNKLQESLNAQYESVVAANEKAENALQSKIEKTKNKKKKASLKKRLSKLKSANAKEEKLMKTAGEKVANAFDMAFNKESDRLTGLAQKKIQELSEAYQKEYDSIVSMRDSLASKQQSWGNVYDLEQNIRDISRYQNNLKALEKRIPESMMERILGMNVDEATAYMDWFRSMTTAQQKAYIANWNKQQSMADSFSKSFFEDDLEELKKEYQTKLKSATDNLKKQMNKAGTNIAKGLAAGIKSETRTVTTEVKSLCNKLINTAKKTLGIHSPSKVFEGIGEYDMEGLERGHESKAKGLYRQMDRLSMTMAQRFAEAPLDLPRIREKMESAVLKQMGRITASVKLPEIKQRDSGRETSQQTMYAGPEKIEVVSVLDGREVARTTVPFMDQFLNDIVTRKLRGGA